MCKDGSIASPEYGRSRRDRPPLDLRDALPTFVATTSEASGLEAEVRDSASLPHTYDYDDIRCMLLEVEAPPLMEDTLDCEPKTDNDLGESRSKACRR